MSISDDDPQVTNPNESLDDIPRAQHMTIQNADVLYIVIEVVILNYLLGGILYVEESSGVIIFGYLLSYVSFLLSFSFDIVIWGFVIAPLIIVTPGLYVYTVHCTVYSVLLSDIMVAKTSFVYASIHCTVYSSVLLVLSDIIVAMTSLRICQYSMQCFKMEDTCKNCPTERIF